MFNSFFIEPLCTYAQLNNGLFMFFLAWIFTNHKYIQDYLDSVPSKYLNKYIYEVITCHKCLSFFLVLISTSNLFLAILFAFTANLNSKI